MLLGVLMVGRGESQYNKKHKVINIIGNLCKSIIISATSYDYSIPPFGIESSIGILSHPQASPFRRADCKPINAR